MNKQMKGRKQNMYSSCQAVSLWPRKKKRESAAAKLFEYLHVPNFYINFGGFFKYHQSSKPNKFLLKEYQ